MMWLAVWMFACSSSPEHVEPNNAPSNQRIRLALNWYPEPEFGGFYEAVRAGHYASAGFDVEIIPGGPGAPSLELLATAHEDAPLLVRSVGAAGLRAGELDLWFEGGRVCWCNNGLAIAAWPRQQALSGDSHAALAPQPVLMPTGLEHYQHEVLEALQEARLQCSLSDGVRTLETLASACADHS